ncbi:TetR family transcriptional regulator [Intrasporangium sp. DVR]|uniref:TetR family transcriptional regulator n=1 Tax=Intrasporangium sp. DVR TaxID=3127867 RepID=UPI00313A53C5
MALTREHVVSTAVELLRRYGLADLSMRRLARELEVQPGALYWHVASKQELLVEVAAALLEEVPSAGSGGSRRAAQAALVDLATAVRRALAPVPDAADVVGIAYAAERGSVTALGELRGLVERAGVPAASRDAVTDLLVHHILGSVALEQNERQVAGADPSYVGRDVAEVATSFATGLDVIVRGMVATKVSSS